MKKSKILLPLAVLALSIGLVGCGGGQSSEEGGTGSSDAAQSSEAVQSSSASKQETIKVTAAEDKKSLLVGETVQLTATVEGVSWESANKEVVTVDDKGLVTAVGLGSAAITAKKDGYKNGRITITVVRPEPNAKIGFEFADHYAADGWWSTSFFGMEFGPGATPVTPVQDSEDVYLGSFGVGDKETLKFSSEKAMKAELIVTMGSGAEIVVKEAMSIKLNDKAVELADQKVTATEGYGAVTFYEISLGSLDLVAGENALVLEMIGESLPSIDELIVYGEDAKAKVEVVPAAVKEAIATTENVEEAIEITEGETRQLAITTEGVSYISTNEEVATVDENGLVTAVKVGKANITVVKEGMLSIRLALSIVAKAVEGQIIVEAESGVTEDGNIKAMAPWGDTVVSGGQYIYTFPKDEVLTLKFEAEEAATMTLSVVGTAKFSMETYTYVDVDLAATFKIEVNGTAVDLTGKTIAAGESTGFTVEFLEVVLGDVSVVAGENTIVVTAIEDGTSLDCFKLSKKA